MPTVERQGRFRSIVRWLAPLGIAAVLAPAWTLYLSGGFRATRGWYILIAAGQVLAPLSLVVLLVHTIRKRRFSRPMQLTFALTALALWPGLWGVGLLTVTFPYDLETARLTATVRLPSNERLRGALGRRPGRDELSCGVPRPAPGVRPLGRTGDARIREPGGLRLLWHASGRPGLRTGSSGHGRRAGRNPREGQWKSREPGWQHRDAGTRDGNVPRHGSPETRQCPGQGGRGCHRGAATRGVREFRQHERAAHRTSITSARTPSSDG